MRKVIDMQMEFWKKNISDIEFDEQKKEAKVKVQDDSFYSRINNNKNINSIR